MNLHPGVNVIVGKSDSGKTAILRAIRWVVFNRPSGDGFVSQHGEGDTSVSLTFDDNKKTVTRSKGTENSYSISKTKFVSFGSEVPQEIKRYLMMDELNFSGQMDQPFFLSLSSGEAARYLNSIIDLTVIDSSLANINGKVRKNMQAIKDQEEKIDDLKKELQESKYIREAKKKLEELEEKQQQLDKQVERYERIEDDYLNWIDISKEIEEIKIVPIQTITKLQNKVTSLILQEQKYNTIFAAYNLWNMQENDLQNLILSIQKEETELEKIKPNRCPLCGGTYK
jgi:DNA repair exonuclease SbcCD ATPase subunit